MQLKPQTVKLDIFADYHQFYLQDDVPINEIAKVNQINPWTKEALKRLLVTERFSIGVGTVRNMNVPVNIYVSKSPKEIDFDKYDLINHCGLEIETGRIVVMGCTDYYPDATRLEIPAGFYELTIGYGNLDKLSEDGLEGDDFYEIFVSLTNKYVETETLKYWAGSKDWA